MSIIRNLGLLGTLAVALVMGLAACQTSGTMTTIATDEPDATLTSWLAKPDGDGPFPAVVLMHGCGGLERNTPHQTVWRGLSRHAAFLNNNGYVTLIVDSFGSRGITDGCFGRNYNWALDQDAGFALDHLSTKSFVNREQIGFLGLSLGGGTALRSAGKTFVDTRIRSGRSIYAAVVAYYPYCGSVYSLLRPVLILIGASDDHVPVQRCHNLAKWYADYVELKVYPNTHHSFDLPIVGKGCVPGADGICHGTVMENPSARRDSQARVLAFFDKHLGISR